MSNFYSNNIKQRLSLREPLAQALDVMAKLVEQLDFKNRPSDGEAYAAFLKEQLRKVKEVCPACKDFERDFPSFAFSIATGIGKTRLMGACIAYLYLAKGIKHFFILAPNLTLYEKLMKDFGDPSYEKYVFRGISEFVHNEPYIITGDNYDMARSLFAENQIQINIFNISKFNTESKEHATETFHRIQDEMFDGRYKGKVLQIDSSTKKDEEIDKQFLSLEKPDNKIEIVIHVNMLKEGWDVTNLYTIVPLRAADAPILVEQQIGRGLRLPYGGKRTGYADIDKLTVIAHENFEAVIAKASDPSSVLSKMSYVELDNDDLTPVQGEVVKAQTLIDIQEQKAVQEAKTEIEKKNAHVISDAKRAVWKVIPQMNTAVKNAQELTRPENIEAIKVLTRSEIIKSAKEVNPLFSTEYAQPLLEEVDKVVEIVVKNFVDNIIEIPRMTIQKEAHKAEYKWFDLDTRMGFDLPALKQEILRVSIGAGEKTMEILQVIDGRKFDPPMDQIVGALMDYDEVDYDENAELLYHLAGQAVEAIEGYLDDKNDLPKVVNQFKKAIAAMIYDQMERHFVVTSLGYLKPTVLPFAGIIDQHLTEIKGFGRVDYRDPVTQTYVKKFIYTGFLKSYYREYKFDSKTELDFANVLEADAKVLKWLRPAPTQFAIFWNNGSQRYEPDFIVETSEAIYMVETKARKDMKAEDVLAKRKAAEEYCKNATEYTSKNGGKPWKYHLLAHDIVDRSSSFEYLMALS